MSLDKIKKYQIIVNAYDKNDIAITLEQYIK